MSNQNKIPIYNDDTEYRIVDALSESSEFLPLQPSNTAASKLCRCIECLKDILEILETAQQTKAKDKLQRRLKMLFTPLFSFVDCLVDLLHDIQSNPDTKRGFPSEVASLVSQMEKRLKENVPFGASQILRTVRDKMSAHVDKNMHPVFVQRLFSKARTHEVGWWLHCSLTVFSDTLKLSIYQWSCESRFPGCIGIMSPDLPILTIWSFDGTKLSHIVGCFLVKSDPRFEVFELVKEVVKQSRWMFREHDPQISHFQEDKPGSNWAKSLETLPKGESKLGIAEAGTIC